MHDYEGRGRLVTCLTWRTELAMPAFDRDRIDRPKGDRFDRHVTFA